MTDNISIMYELAGVEKIKTCYWNCKHSFPCEECCIYKDETVDFVYPPFTDTKQLELIKWLAFKKRFSLKYINAKWHFDNSEWGVSSTIKYEPFEQALAGLLCELWEDLTDTQREEVRGILQ